jgi:hypothetical protein
MSIGAPLRLAPTAAAWLSDALCRLASGGSFAVRQLYTKEVLFKAARPTLGRLRALGHGLRNRSLARQHLHSRLRSNRKAAIEGIIDADPIAACVRELICCPGKNLPIRPPI